MSQPAQVQAPSFLRHSGLIGPADLHEKMHIIGVGATGSHIAMTAARMGFTNFILWDHDDVESHNLPNQAYYSRHIGMPKVEALRDLLVEFNPNIRVETHQEYFETAKHKDTLSGVLVLTVDSMKARKDIYDSFSFNRNISLVLETGLGFTYGKMNFIDPMDLEECEAWNAKLVSDDELPESPCNMRIIATLVPFIAAAAVHGICDYYVAKKEARAWERPSTTAFYMQGTSLAVNQIRMQK